eukprot:TRINITY_DN7460_c0_g1_i1.p1 TRINITY_DN7460_c0_g1~~TRINITY_DN7460_c0_g1_i1.p1  ORF type:complete len:327 (-),score=99.56 TRINITY_DN7460_c0_g1_i1:150-1094(-)
MQWAQPKTAGAIPTPLSRHTSTVVGSKMYIIGGSYSFFDEQKNEEVDIFNDLLVLDLETMYWTKPPTHGVAPGPHRSHTASNIGDGKILVFGGGDGPNYFNDSWILDTTTMDWSNPKVGGQVPPPRRAHTATVVGSKLYVFGGGNGDRAFNDIYALDIASMQWAQVNPRGAVTGRGYHTAVSYGDKIFFFGGSDMANVLDDLVVFDTVGNTMVTKKLASSRSLFAHTSTVVGSWMFIFGGCDNDEYISELGILDLASLDWVKVPLFGALPPARYHHTVVYNDYRLVMLGGNSSNTILDDLWVLDLGTFAYLARA